MLYLLSQLREVLSCLLRNEAQPKDGAVKVRGLIEGASFQVAILIILNVPSEETQT